MTAGSKRVVFDREPGVEFEEAVLEFRLTYEGPLYSTQRDPFADSQTRERRTSTRSEKPFTHS
jgi:hypothetical protein